MSSLQCFFTFDHEHNCSVNVYCIPPVPSSGYMPEDYLELLQLELQGLSVLERMGSLDLDPQGVSEAQSELCYSLSG